MHKYSSICDEFYVNMHLNTEMDLPQNRESVLGQMGLPGGGISFGFSAVNSVGNEFTVIRGAALPQGERGVE
ncbi:MAG: hypothetical protein AAF394_17200, partial [Planctomycetota bacterium]